MVGEKSFGEFVLSPDKDRLDIDAIHDFLANRSYWAAGATRESVVQRIAHSDSFGLYHAPTGALAGFARLITDRTTFAYLCDVFVLEPFRGQGLGVWLVEAIVDDPAVQALRRVTLFTRDAHSLYERFGFEALDDDQFTKFMHRFIPSRLEVPT